MRALHAKIAAELAQQRWTILPTFFGAAEWAPLQERARRAWSAGELQQAGVGQGADRLVRPEVRGDWIGWLDPGEDALGAYLVRMEELRLELNRSAYLGLFEFETHFAVYPPGAAYTRHADRFARDARRVLSTVLYLNADWEPTDGGALRIHLADGAHVDIEPRGGTLVVFASELEHEVLPARRERFSLAGWFKRRA
jgi:SM-20-related protein